MTSLTRAALGAFVLVILGALHLQVHQARATDAASRPAMTLVMVPAALIPALPVTSRPMRPVARGVTPPALDGLCGASPPAIG